LDEYEIRMINPIYNDRVELRKATDMFGREYTDIYICGEYYNSFNTELEAKEEKKRISMEANYENAKNTREG
jgi:hypothetical protein